MKNKKILRFAILSGLIFNISVSCAKKDDDEKVSSTTSYTAATLPAIQVQLLPQ